MNTFTSLAGIATIPSGLDIDCFITIDDEGDCYITVEEDGKLLLIEPLSDSIIDTLPSDLLNHQSREITSLFKFLRQSKEEVLKGAGTAKFAIIQQRMGAR